ncbi:MAG: hypothetical protein KY476_12080 [Planctomycetes bacterium]|nr:hypothetical protein [Planctomycetota bacterium]
MTTVAVDDELYQRATEAASALGKTVNQYVEGVLRRAMSGAAVHRTWKNGLPVLVPDDETPPIDPHVVRRQLEEYGL